MPFDVNTFRSTLVNDGARPSLFQVFMTLPPVLGQVPLSPDISFKIRASSLPGDTLNSISIPYFGREIKVAGTRTFNDWSFTVINDEGFVARNNLETWMNLINSHVGNLRDINAQSAASYQADAIVTQFSKVGVPLKSYRIVGAFPIDVAPIDLDWALGDQIEEFGVTFAFQWWEAITTDSTGATTIGGII